MPIDNDLYNRLASTWWEDGSFLSVLKTTVNPVRLEYLDQVVKDRETKSRQFSVLDVGCGGGYLTEEISKRGFIAYGVDRSVESLKVARDHACKSGLVIEYKAARAELLPYPDHSFDIVTCCDVLEHVLDLEQTLQEISRVLKPGGIFIFDTINRTFMTWLGVIFVAQEFPLTRFFPPKTHEWSMFITPGELTEHLGSSSIRTMEIKGMSSAVTPLHQFWLILRLKWGSITLQEYGLRTQVHLSKDMIMNYIGYGIKE